MGRKKYPKVQALRRKVVGMRLEQGLSVPEIAEELRIPRYRVRRYLRDSPEAVETLGSPEERAEKLRRRVIELDAQGQTPSQIAEDVVERTPHPCDPGRRPRRT